MNISSLFFLTSNHPCVSYVGPGLFGIRYFYNKHPLTRATGTAVYSQVSSHTAEGINQLPVLDRGGLLDVTSNGGARDLSWIHVSLTNNGWDAKYVWLRLKSAIPERWTPSHPIRGTGVHSFAV